MGEQKKSVSLVTGGAGFIGSHITKRLLEQGHRVIVIDNLSTGKRDNLAAISLHPQLEFLQEDAANPRLSDLYLRADFIYHFAAMSSVPLVSETPVQAQEINVMLPLRILETIRKSKVLKKFIFSSSAAVFGNAGGEKISELTPTTPLSLYGMQKLHVEQLCSFFADQFSIPSMVLRFFNVYGPRQNPNSSYSGVVNRFIKGLRDGTGISIHGDGRQVRDFIYVEDIARATCQAAQSEATGYFNLGSGTPTSILELAQMLKMLSKNLAAPIKFSPKRTGDIDYSLCDSTKFNQRFEFSCRYNLEEGLRSLLETEKT